MQYICAFRTADKPPPELKTQSLPPTTYKEMSAHQLGHRGSVSRARANTSFGARLVGFTFDISVVWSTSASSVWSLIFSVLYLLFSGLISVYFFQPTKALAYRRARVNIDTALLAWICLTFKHKLIRTFVIN